MQMLAEEASYLGNRKALTARSATSDIDSYFDSLITSSRKVTAANRNRNTDDRMAGTESSAAKHSRRAHANHEIHRQAMSTEEDDVNKAKGISTATLPTTPTTPTTAAAVPSPVSGAGAATVAQAVAAVTPAVTWIKHIDPESGQAYLVSSSGLHQWVQETPVETPVETPSTLQRKSVVDKGFAEAGARHRASEQEPANLRAEGYHFSAETQEHKGNPVLNPAHELSARLQKSLHLALADCDSEGPNCQHLEGRLGRLGRLNQLKDGSSAFATRKGRDRHTQMLPASTQSAFFGGGAASLQTVTKGQPDSVGGFGGPITWQTANKGQPDHIGGHGGPVTWMTSKKVLGDAELMASMYASGGPITKITTQPLDSEGSTGPVSWQTKQPLESQGSSGPITKITTQPLDSDSWGGPITKITTQPLDSEGSSGPITKMLTQPLESEGSSGPITKMLTQPLDSEGSSGPITKMLTQPLDSEGSSGPITKMLTQPLETEVRV